MNGHLPECPSSSSDPLAADCQCHRLRACEQRVLDAAREALFGMNPAAYLHMPRVDAGQTLVFLADAISAIDALKEKR